jgi:hypothetical protein
VQTAVPVWPLGHMHCNKPAQAALIAQHTTMVSRWSQPARLTSNTAGRMSRKTIPSEVAVDQGATSNP